MIASGWDSRPWIEFGTASNTVCVRPRKSPASLLHFVELEEIGRGLAVVAEDPQA